MYVEFEVELEGHCRERQEKRGKTESWNIQEKRSKQRLRRETREMGKPRQK